LCGKGHEFREALASRKNNEEEILIVRMIGLLLGIVFVAMLPGLLLRPARFREIGTGASGTYYWKIAPLASSMEVLPRVDRRLVDSKPLHNGGEENAVLPGRVQYETHTRWK